jgi:hypothetical protein
VLGVDAIRRAPRAQVRPVARVGRIARLTDELPDKRLAASRVEVVVRGGARGERRARLGEEEEPLCRRVALLRVAEHCHARGDERVAKALHMHEMVGRQDAVDDGHRELRG